MVEDSQAKVFLRGNGIHVWSGVTAGEIKQEIIERSLEQQSAEKLAVIKDLANNLSVEAGQVIKIVLNAPEEMVQYLWGSREKQITKITQHDLRQYLNWSKGWPFLLIEEVFGELKRFVKNF